MTAFVGLVASYSFPGALTLYYIQAFSQQTTWGVGFLVSQLAWLCVVPSPSLRLTVWFEKTNGTRFLWLLGSFTLFSSLLLVPPAQTEVSLLLWFILAAHISVAASLGGWVCILLGFFTALSTYQTCGFDESSWPTYLLTALGFLHLWYKDRDEPGATSHETTREPPGIPIEAVDRLYRQALIGSQVRLISHEIQNFISILDMATADEENPRLDLAQKGLSYLRNITRIILSEGRGEEQKRPITVRQLMDDIDLLLKKGVIDAGIEWQAYWDDDLKNVRFLEIEGSTYFILQNLIKNSIEAIGDNHTPHSEISVKVECMTSTCLLVQVVDNGPGISEEGVENIRRGVPFSTKPHGNGLGMQFVTRECERNNFKLKIHSDPGKVTRFEILIPLESQGESQDPS